MNLTDFIFISTVKCPSCGHQEKVAMPKYAQKYFYQCQQCKYLIQTKKNECCIFCMYGDTPCPTEQHKRRMKDLGSKENNSLWLSNDKLSDPE